MKKIAVVFLFVLGIVACYFWIIRSPTHVVGVPPAAAPSAAGTAPMASPAPGITPAVPAAPAAPATQEASPIAAATSVPPAPSNAEASQLPPLTVLDNARVAVHNYNGVFGENPVGDNSEITAALMGKNPKQVNFIREDSGLRVNDKGEMIDAWGTPFFFHQLSGQVMEIRSAGEDKKMWTFDDQVTR